MAAENQSWGTDPGKVVEVGGRSEQTDDPEIHAEKEEVEFFEPKLGNFFE